MSSLRSACGKSTQVLQIFYPVSLRLNTPNEPLVECFVFIHSGSRLGIAKMGSVKHSLLFLVKMHYKTLFQCVWSYKGSNKGGCLHDIQKNIWTWSWSLKSCKESGFDNQDWGLTAKERRFDQEDIEPARIGLPANCPRFLDPKQTTWGCVAFRKWLIIR